MTESDKKRVVDVLKGLQDEVQVEYDKIEKDISECATIDLLVERKAKSHEKAILTTAMLRVFDIS